LTGAGTPVFRRQRFLEIRTGTMWLFACIVAQGSKDASALFKFLKTRHDLRTIPVAEVGQNVNVQIGLLILQIIELVR